MSDRRDLMKCLVLATLLSVSIPVVGDLCVYGIEYSKFKRIEYSRFKRICQEGIANKTMPTVPVDIEITKDYVISNISIVMAGPVGQELHPITVLRLTQVNIESLRVFANELERRRGFWAPHLQAAERVVAEALGRVQDGRLNASERQRTAAEANEKVTQIFQEAIESYAKRTERQVRQRMQAPPSIKFNVKTNPSGLTVQLLLVGDYFLLSKLDPGASIHESPLWVSLPASGPARAYGVYYYRFRKDGRIVRPAFSKERVKHITSSQDVILFE